MTIKKISSAEIKKTKTPRSSKAKEPKLSGETQLPCAYGEQCFWVHNGPILSNLIELRDMLREIQEDVYVHHVDASRNDFAEWVEHVLSDAALAKALRKARDQKDAYTVVVKRLKVYGV